MRKPIWIVPALLLVAALGAPNAQATDIITDYTITFTGSPGTLLPTAGSFEYDATTQSFLDFLVVWNGTTFDLTSSANSPDVLNLPPDCVSISGPSDGAQLSLLLLSNCPLTNANAAWIGSNQNEGLLPETTFDFYAPEGGSSSIDVGAQLAPNGVDALASGSWTIEETVATPEPTTLILMLTGFMLVFVLRKRKAQGLPQPT